jgi:hypothetical protein
MRIDWSPQVQTASPRREVRTTEGGSSFADAVASEPQAAPTSAPAAPPTIEGLFALQEVADELTNRRRAAARGSALLDRLDDLRLALLSGKMPRTQLEQLREMAREHGPAADDPKLAGILSDIELRVAVELAKLDKLA